MDGEGLPTEVVNCLENTRFLHLATCQNDTPHISLMSYTYLPSTPYSTGPTIVMTTPPSSKKTSYLLANPKVSLLVHDWVSHRPPTLASASDGLSTSPDAQGRASSLASLLYGMNSAALSRISISINGTASVVPIGGEEEAWYKARHKENNSFGDLVDNSDILEGSAEGSGGAGCYIDGQEVRVVVVNVQDGRISDFKGMVKDWSLHGEPRPTVNGS
jgi:hypothetical protein